MLTRQEQAVAEAELGDAPPVLILRSRTRVDAGRWWRRTRLWLVVMEAELVVFTAARRRYFCRVPFAECGNSHYCHDSGELVIAPAEKLRFRRFAVSPSQAMEVLCYLGIEL